MIEDRSPLRASSKAPLWRSIAGPSIGGRASGSVRYNGAKTATLEGSTTRAPAAGQKHASASRAASHGTAFDINRLKLRRQAAEVKGEDLGDQRSSAILSRLPPDWSRTWETHWTARLGRHIHNLETCDIGYCFSQTYWPPLARMDTYRDIDGRKWLNGHRGIRRQL